MTAAGHVAAYEHAGPAALRAHLAFEHPVTCHHFWAYSAVLASAAHLHRLIHQPDPEPDFPAKGTP